MKRSLQRLLALALTLCCLLAFGSTTANQPTSDSPVLPLWEPDWSPASLPERDFPVDAVEADVTGDGVKDFVILGLNSLYKFVLDEEGAHLYRLPIGDRFREFGASLAGSSLASGDLNGDGFDDLVVATRGNGIWIFLQQERAGDFVATTGQRIEYGGIFTKAWLADHTGDGILDLILPDRVGDDGWLFVFAGDGSGEFGEPIPIAGFDLEIQDMYTVNDPTEPGIWAVTHGGTWFLPQGADQAEERFSLGGKTITVADLDKDGDLDVCVAGTSLRVYWNEADQYRIDDLYLGYIARNIDHGDLDGDGDPDLVVWNLSPMETTVFNNREGKSFERSSYGAGYSSMAESVTGAICADVTGDGLADVVSMSFFGRVTVLTTQEGGSTNQLLQGAFLFCEMDMDGDGKPEILTDWPDKHLAYLSANSTGVFEPILMPREGFDDRQYYDWWTLFALSCDLDGDGVSTLVLWEENGQGAQFLSGWESNENVWTQTWQVPLRGGTTPRLVAGDIDSDGREELLIADGMHFNVYALDGDEPVLSDRIPWGDDIAPFAMADLSQGERLVGFRAAYRVTEFLWLDSEGVHNTSVELPAASPLDIVAYDLDDDGFDELVYTALAVRYENELPYLAVEVGILRYDRTGNWTIQGPWELHGWPTESVPYPYGGLAVVEANEGAARIAISYTEGRYTNGGVAWVALPSDPAQHVTVSYQARIAGPVLFSQHVGGHPVIISVTSTDPQILRVLRWPE